MQLKLRISQGLQMSCGLDISVDLWYNIFKQNSAEEI